MFVWLTEPQIEAIKDALLSSRAADNGIVQAFMQAHHEEWKHNIVQHAAGEAANTIEKLAPTLPMQQIQQKQEALAHMMAIRQAVGDLQEYR